ncbi:hypothetical protein ACW9H6_14445 [Pseudomonas sp. SDO528_S397]
MSDAKKVNGYLIEKHDGQWWMVGFENERVAGPFAKESDAVDVANVFEDLAPRASQKTKR